MSVGENIRRNGDALADQRFAANRPPSTIGAMHRSRCEAPREPPWGHRRRTLIVASPVGGALTSQEAHFARRWLALGSPGRPRISDRQRRHRCRRHRSSSTSSASSRQSGLITTTTPALAARASGASKRMTVVAGLPGAVKRGFRRLFRGPRSDRPTSWQRRVSSDRHLNRARNQNPVVDRRASIC